MFSMYWTKLFEAKRDLNEDLDKKQQDWHATLAERILRIWTGDKKVSQSDYMQLLKYLI
jgi:hypothetical protein